MRKKNFLTNKVEKRKLKETCLLIHLRFPFNFPFQIRNVKLRRKENMFHGQKIQMIKGEYGIQKLMGAVDASLRTNYYISEQ